MDWRRLLLGRRNSPLDRMTVHEFQYDDARVRIYEMWNMRPEAAEASDVVTFGLVHGLGVSSRFFVPLAHTLADYGRVLLFDLPGFHDLPKPKRRLSIVDFADIVKRALDELEVTAPILVGHSMGSQVVTEILAQYPDFCDTAMLVGPVVVSDERTLGDVAMRFAQSALFESPTNALAAIASYVRAGPRWIGDTVPKVLDYPIEERLGRVKARVVFVAGANDQVSPLWWRRELADEVSDGRVKTIDGAAHGLVHDHYQQLADELLALAGVGTA